LLQSIANLKHQTGKSQKRANRLSLVWLLSFFCTVALQG